MPYFNYSVSLNEGQKKRLATAVKNKRPFSMKILYPQLREGNITLLVTQTQYNNIKKALNNKTGVTLRFSKKQLESNQKGGILPILIPAIVAGVATLGATAIKALIDRIPQKGKGLDDQVNVKEVDKLINVALKSQNLNQQLEKGQLGSGFPLIQSPRAYGFLVDERPQPQPDPQSSSKNLDFNQVAQGLFLPGAQMGQGDVKKKLLMERKRIADNSGEGLFLPGTRPNRRRR